MESFNKFTQSVSTNWTPFADKVGKSFTQYKQLATEKLANNAEVTSLPNDYVQLEQRYEAVRHATQSLVKLAKSYTAAPTHYDVQTLQNQLANLTEDQTPNTHQHAMARTALEVSEKVGLEEPLGAALFKFGSIEEKVGDGKLAQDKTIQDKFVAPMMATIESSIALAQNARKEVQAARLTLDAAKSTFKNSVPSRADAARRDVESAEDRFVTIVEEAMNLMRAVVGSPEPLRYLSELVNAQLEYHKAAASLLSDLAPEIDEIQVTQEALYRHENK
ncbi:hypothetical protein DL89DRAFT_238228 [Linderina pennispora]|uniref:BAR domain-containing protein n=2 Tax=Linderina pennispora TaxID=61395 RepID=A0A1Y1VZA1_9FUNG|nr:uncharacterized protein DL89DRAFT_238228 [Linderina pennispora]ORX66598.1 hypothetical protein DL89DRAFT_238228 [Linderina pennispora]